MAKNYDFCGWATRHNVKCSDGRTIRRSAFAEQDGQWVPMVWQHQHNSPENVLGKALLKHTDDGMYAYGYFNETDNGINAKEMV